MDSASVDPAASDPGAAPAFLRDLEQLGDEADRAHVLRELICIAGDEVGAWIALCALCEWIAQRMACGDRETMVLEGPAAPKDADWLAGRMASDFLGMVRPLPFGAPHLVKAARLRGPVDELGAIEASKRAKDLCTLAAAALKVVGHTWDEGPLPAWRELLLPSPGTRRTLLARDFVQVAGERGKAEGRRVHAAIAAACLAIIDREFFGAKRTDPVWASLKSLAEQGDLPPLVCSIVLEALSTPRSSGEFACHLATASFQPPPTDRALLDIVLENAIQGVGCPRRGVANLDPLSRTIRELLGALVLEEPDEMLSASLLRDGLFTLGKGTSGMGAEGPSRGVDRFLWGTSILGPLLARSACPLQRDRALIALALLAQGDVRERRQNPAEQRNGPELDVRRASAYSLLFARTPDAKVSPGARLLAQQVLDCGVGDEGAFCAGATSLLRDAVKVNGFGGANRPDVPPDVVAGLAPEVPAPLPTPSEADWLVWWLYDVEKAGIQAEVGRLAGERLKREAIPQPTVSRIVLAVRAFRTAGGKIPEAFQVSGSKTKRVRGMDPGSLEKGSPRDSRRPRVEE